MTFLEQKIRDAHTAGRTALIPFVTAGFPTLDTFWGIIEELDANGADVIEIGVPFSDPVADGPVVEDASRRALEQGVSLNWIMDGLKQRAGNFKAGIVLMGYLNPFLQYGLERFAADAAQAGVSGCIVPDLPLDESAPVRTTLKAHGIDLIALVGQNTSEERMREYAAVSEGYVYVVSVLGTTGARTDCRRKWKRRCAGRGKPSTCRWLWASVCSTRTSLPPFPPTSGPTPPCSAAPS